MELSRLTPILLLIISTVSHTIKVTYRGCFDGWLGGLVDHNYNGCKAQTYLGKTVEWCFCKTDSKKWKKDPCNGGSRKALAKTAKTSFPQRAFNEVKLNLLESSYGSPGKAIKSVKGGKKVSKYYKSLPEDDKADSTHYPEYADYEDAELESNQIFESRPNNICSGRVDGQYVDEEDCSKYYICTNGVPYHMSCPVATMWNQILRGCSYSYHPLFPCKVQEEQEQDGIFRLSFYPRKKPLFRIQRIDKQNEAFP